MKDVAGVILNVLVKNLASTFEARCFAGTLNMTIWRLHFQSSVLVKNLAAKSRAGCFATTLGMATLVLG